MMKWPSSCCLFKLHWWEGACLGFFPLSSWLNWNRCLNSRNIWMWVFKWGYKPQEKEQLQVADLEYRSWLELAQNKFLKKKHPFTCLFIDHLSIQIYRSTTTCWEPGLVLGRFSHSSINADKLICNNVLKEHFTYTLRRSILKWGAYFSYFSQMRFLGLERPLNYAHGICTYVYPGASKQGSWIQMEVSLFVENNSPSTRLCLK